MSKSRIGVVNARRWMHRTAVAVAGITIVAVVTGAGYEASARTRAFQDAPVRGRLVDIGSGRRLQLDCRGAGSPTVVLESGLDFYGSLSWMAVHDSIAATTRVCAYSRPGIMWSDPASGPLDLRARARELHAALIAAGESAPWVMIAHSLGGPYITIFTNSDRDEVAGMVFVDTSHPDQFARFAEATGKSLRPGAGVVRVAGSLAWTGLVRLAAPDNAPPTWPADVARLSHIFLPTSLSELAAETEHIPSTLREASPFRSFGDLPLVVLSSGLGSSPQEIADMGLTPAQAERLAAAKRRLHDDQATWSRRGRHEIVAGAGHYIQFDRPNAVIGAAREVILAARFRSTNDREAPTHQ
jgi:pimeloyl-ACP methyl ester carboxylesterase